MSRLTDALLGSSAFGVGANQPMLDPTYGGWFGFAPVMKEWISNQAYMRRNLVPILLEAPKFFQLMPNPEKWVSCLRSIVELHAKTWEGFNGGLTAEFDEHPAGGGGEMQQELTDVKRARTEPSMTIVEKYGMPVQTLLHHWMTYGMMDPDAKFALANTLEGNQPDDMLADWFTMTMAFIEPCPMHKRAVKTWITTNMMPKTTGEIIGKRDLNSPSEISTLTIDWTGLSVFNLGSNAAGQLLLDGINMTNANPYLRPAWINAVAAEVEDAVNGYRSNVETLGGEAVTTMG